MSGEELVRSNEPQGMYGIRVTTSTGHYEYVVIGTRLFIGDDGGLEVLDARDRVRAAFAVGSWTQAVPYSMK